MVLEHCPSSHCHLSINQVSFNPCCTLQDLARTSNHYERKNWLWGDNSINIQGRIMVLEHCPSSHCHLSINQVSFNPCCTLQDLARTSNHYERKNWLWGDNSINIQGRIMVLAYCPSSHCHLYINQASFKSYQ